MKYALLDTNGNIKEVGENNELPNNAIEITSGEYDNIMLGGKWKNINGTIQKIPLSTNELLENAKVAKLQELETAFIIASKLPVTVGTKTYNGGKESAQALRDYIQLVTESGGTSFTIWDSSNSISTYTLSEATAIKLAVATEVAQGEFNLRMKKNAVNDATTITAVNAVTY